MHPGAERPDFGGKLGAIVQKAVHLRDRLDHAQIALGNDARNHRRGVLVRIDDRRFENRFAVRELGAQGVRRRRVPDADVCG
jgi:hypothetical protein